MSAENRNGEGNPEASEGIQPKYRRSFGCVTWIYMATLAFLAAVSVLMMPFWFFGDFGVFSLLEGPSLFATFLFVPAIVTAAMLGARTYRSERKIATRNGTYIGTVIGWLGFTSIVWLEVNQAGASILSYIFIPLAAISSALILYALFRGEQESGRKLVAASAILALVGGAVVLALDGSLIVAAGAVVSAISGAAGGWTAGVGYARAGGKEMLPPGIVERPRRRPTR
ncbi:MAG: hypothetical protein M3494_04375 [Actinomycetota bacterium]|jgi:hypothetical protein|nr:hypothetical protein [Rubrobacter sp.]MDQ3507241.1 hypothetical protein [Actinomycetota bacterium]